MILHIFPYEKFTQDYVKKINFLFDSSQHIFWIYGNKANTAIKDVNADNIIFESDIRKSHYREIYKKIKQADKVIFHSLFFGTRLLLFYTILSFFNKEKFFWNIWGADLYNEYWHRKDNIRNKIREDIKKKFIKNLRAVGYIEGDYSFLRQHYRTAAKFYLASYIYDFFLPEVASNNDDTVNILLGNSATEECRYHEMIEQLYFCKNNDIKIYCVLSYPESNKVYRESVIKHGIDVFGDKFIPLIDFMAFEKYIEMLSVIDIAIFNHNRQQALGNIASLLYLGKRVYINPDNGCKGYFEKMGAKVFSTDSLTKRDICKIDSKELKDINRKAIDEFFSDQQFKERWRKIFDEKY